MLETERLILRNFEMTDFEDYWELVSSEEAMLRAGKRPDKDRNESKRMLSSLINYPWIYAIILKNNNKVIGLVDLEDDLEVGQSKEIRCFLAQKYWGQGYMQEAIEEIIRYAFEDLGIQTIYIKHLVANINSSRLQDKLGFKVSYVGNETREWIDGTKSNIVYRQMTSDDYFERKFKR